MEVHVTNIRLYHNPSIFLLTSLSKINRNQIAQTQVPRGFTAIISALFHRPGLFSAILQYPVQLLASLLQWRHPPLKRKNSTTAKWGVQGRNMRALIKINNAPILKIGILPSSNCGNFTLMELWKLSERSSNLSIYHCTDFLPLPSLRDPDSIVLA